MAVFTRINGDSAGVPNVDAGRSFANASIINTGIGAPLTAYKITLPNNGNLAAELTVGGAVETILRIVEGNASVLAYQVDANLAASGNGGNISVLVERSGWASDTALQNTIRSYVGQDNASNIGATGACWGNLATVTSSMGLRLGSPTAN